MLALVALALSSASAAPLRADPPVPVWPTHWFSVIAENRTTADGEIGPFRSSLSWYGLDAGGGGALRVDSSLDGLTTSILHVGTTLYTYTPAFEQCVGVPLGIGILRPDWLLGAEFLGERVVDGRVTHLWNKEGAGNDHFYYATPTIPPRPVRMVVIDEKGDLVQKDYAAYLPGEENVPASTFDIPPYCNATVA